MEKKNLTLTIKLPWWYGIYYRACIMFAVMTGNKPDTDKIVSKIIKHSKRIEG